MMLFTILICCQIVGAKDSERFGNESSALELQRHFIRKYDKLRNWRGNEMSYQVNLPANYRKDRLYPIIFEWPGKGGSPNTNVFTGIYKVKGHIHVGLDYAWGSRNGTAMLYATPQYVAFIQYVYDDVIENFNGNREYVFIGGFSAGGFMATGPGISLMIRAGLRDQLAGVVAGGCNWMCDPRYARDLNILIWYSDNDVNSFDLPRRLPEIEKYARQLVVVMHPNGGHRCDDVYGGATIRRFFGINGPDRDDFVLLERIAQSNNTTVKQDAIQICRSIIDKENTASYRAQQLLHHWGAE